MSKDASKEDGSGKSGPSTGAVLAAVAGSAALTVTKFVAFAFSASAAMLAEAVHSLVDTANNLLLYLGQRRSSRPPDPQHPFGYGKELYFWTLIVALVIFTLGGVVTVIEGVVRVVQPEELTGLTWNYAVLGLAAVFNGFSWAVALKEFLAGKGDRSLWQALKKAKDPTILTVLCEDSASLVGLVIAFLGLFLGDRLHLPALDGIASILIGLLLGAVAVGLAYQSKVLLVGETANDEVVNDVRALAEKDPDVEEIGDLLTMHLSPKDILLNLKIRLREGLSVPDLEGAVDRLEHAIRERHPDVKRIFIEPGPVAADNGSMERLD